MTEDHHQERKDRVGGLGIGLISGFQNENTRDSGTPRPSDSPHAPATSSNGHLRALRNEADRLGSHGGLSKSTRTKEPTFSSEESPHLEPRGHLAAGMKPLDLQPGPLLLPPRNLGHKGEHMPGHEFCWSWGCKLGRL